jgi:hypothetical protein
MENQERWVRLARHLSEIREVEEKFRKIQENPALYGAEYALTPHELEIIEKVINLSGEINIAGKEILKRYGI